jgi:hypothetical protein
VLKTAPKVFYRADGNLSSNALKWIEYLKENNLPLSIKEINEILEDIDIDYTLNYLYYTPVLLIILDLFLDGVLHDEKRNQFY